MVQGIIDFGRRIRAEHWSEPGDVLEVGSYNVNGTIRDAFQSGSASYLGVDMADGPCVDRVIEATRLLEEFAPESFDTILCCECLEHTIKPWVVVDAMKALLRPHGLLFISTPTFGFGLHRYPIDCYRFGEDAYRLALFEGFQILELEHIPGNIIACAGVKRG